MRPTPPCAPRRSTPPLLVAEAVCVSIVHKSVAEVPLAGHDTLAVERDRFRRRLRRLLGEEHIGLGAVGGDAERFTGESKAIAAVGDVPRVVHQVLRSLHRRLGYGKVIGVHAVDVCVEEVLSVTEGDEVLVVEEPRDVGGGRLERAAVDDRRCSRRRRRAVAVPVLAPAAAGAGVIASSRRHSATNPTGSA